MHWILQSNVMNEAAYDEFIATFERAGVPFTQIKVIPFSHELDPIPEVENPIAVYGSTTLVRIAKKYGWGPGVFWDEELNFQSWLPHWGANLLNAGAQVVRFEDIKFNGVRFIRPVDDLKLFAGEVVNWENFAEWQEKVLRYDDGMVNRDTLCVVAKPKNINKEYRFFVVNGEIVTGSEYKIGNRLHLHRIDSSYDAWGFAQHMVDMWQPDRGFVIDIADVDGEPYIIEVNNLNSSGFYDCDVSKIIQAVDALI